MSHLKRLLAPKTWPVERKEIVYITKPLPIGFEMRFGLPLAYVVKEMLHVCRSTKELKYLFSNKLINVNGKIVTEPRSLIGLFDVLVIGDRKFRIIMRHTGKLDAIAIKSEHPAIINKVMNKIKAKKAVLQINLFNGKNINIDAEQSKQINVGDSVITNTDKLEVLPLAKHSMAVLFDGRHRGMIGEITHIDDAYVALNVDGNAIKTLKKYCYVVSKPKEKSVIELG